MSHWNTIRCEYFVKFEHKQHTPKYNNIFDRKHNLYLSLVGNAILYRIHQFSFLCCEYTLQIYRSWSSERNSPQTHLNIHFTLRIYRCILLLWLAAKLVSPSHSPLYDYPFLFLVYDRCATFVASVPNDTSQHTRWTVWSIQLCGVSCRGQGWRGKARSRFILYISSITGTFRKGSHYS